jgi:predicted lipoprotein with Yx(FWY)xxD motif
LATIGCLVRIKNDPIIRKAAMNGIQRTLFPIMLCALLLIASAVMATSGPTQAGSRLQAAAVLVKPARAQMLVTSRGMTLYLLAADKKNESTCTAGCAAAWPPLLLPPGTAARLHLPGFTGTFGTAHRSDGANQLTYDGAPLYTFIKDRKPGDMNGQGVAGTWWAAVVPTTSSFLAVSSLVKTAPVKVLVNASGMTLYVFASDSKNQSTCTGGCAKYWPPLELSSGKTAPKSVAGIPGAFAVATHSDGSMQLTYDGAPLYTFLEDKKPGDMTGQGVATTWWIVVVTSVPAGSAAPALQATAPKTANTATSTPLPTNTVVPQPITTTPAPPTSTAAAPTSTAVPPATNTPAPMPTAATAPQPTATYGTY